MYQTTIFGQGRVTSAHNPPPRTVSIRQRVQTQSASTRHACMEPLAGPRLGSPMDLPMCPNLLDRNWQSGASLYRMCVAVDKV